MVHIKDTLSLTRLAVSRAFEQEATANNELELLGSWNELELDSDGNIVSPFCG